MVTPYKVSKFNGTKPATLMTIGWLLRDIMMRMDRLKLSDARIQSQPNTASRTASSWKKKNPPSKLETAQATDRLAGFGVPPFVM
jgi:hypothetical protein